MSPQKLRLLVIEDSLAAEIIRFNLSLDPNGKPWHDVDLAGELGVGIAMFHEAREKGRPYRGVLLDLCLPDSLVPLETFQRAKESFGECPIVVHTAMRGAELEDRLKELGADGVVHKSLGTRKSEPRLAIERAALATPDPPSGIPSSVWPPATPLPPATEERLREAEAAAVDAATSIAALARQHERSVKSDPADLRGSWQAVSEADVALRLARMQVTLADYVANLAEVRAEVRAELANMRANDARQDEAIATGRHEAIKLVEAKFADLSTGSKLRITGVAGTIMTLVVALVELLQYLARHAP